LPCFIYKLSQQKLNTKQEDITSWVNNHSDDLYSWALYKTSSQEVAEDIIQDTFAAAVKSYEKFQRKSSPKTWLFTIANRLIIDYFRKKAKSNFVFLESDLIQNNFDNGAWKHQEGKGFTTDIALLDDPEFLEIYKLCLDKLPQRWKAIVISKYIELKDNKMICQEFEITQSNLWQIIHRSKLQLKNCLDSNWDNE